MVCVLHAWWSVQLLLVVAFLLLNSRMGNGTKFKLSSMFPGVLSKIKGMTGGKRVKGKGGANPGEWSDDLQDSSASKDSPGSPLRTFPQSRDRDTQRYCSSPPCSSPVNIKSYDIRFPIESPVRRGGLKSRPISPPGRSVNSTDSLDSTSLVQQDRIRRGGRSRCNSDSELDVTDSESARGAQHLRVRTMSLQLDGTMDWERERERDWSEPENVRGSRRTRRMRDTKVEREEEEESSPILTVRCMPPNTPSDIGNYSDPHELDHRSACPDFSSRKITTALQFHERKLGFTADDTRLFDDTSFSSDDDFFKVRSGHINAQFRRKKVNNYVVSGDMTDDSERLLTEDEERSLHAKTVRSSAAAGDGWGRSQSRFAEEEKHQQHQQRTRGGGRMSYDRKVPVTEDGRHHAVLSRRETSSLVKTKDWARENLRALSKASELEKQTKQQQFIRATDSLVEYESFGLPVIHKEHHRQQYSRESSKTISPVGEVEKHTKGRIDYKSSPIDLHHHGSDNLAYEHFSQPLAEYASDFYKNAHTEESDFETSNQAPRPWEVEFPSYRSDKGTRRSGPLELMSDSGGPTRRTNHSLSAQERSSGRTPRKQPPSSTTANTTSREALGRKSSRSSSPKVQDFPPINFTKPSPRSGSPRRQELHSGKRSSSPRTPSAKHEVVTSKKVGRSQSPRRQEVSGRKSSSVSPFPGGQQQEASKMGNARSESPAAYSRLDDEKKGAAAEEGNGRSSNQAMRTLEERPTVMGSDSVAVVKASYDPYQDFRESMVEMILENEIQTAEDLEELLQCYLSLNSAEYHPIIVQVFSDIWRDIFDH